MKFVPKLLLSVLFAASTTVTSAATYTELFVFGDSLSDPGNALYLTKDFPVPNSGTFFLNNMAGNAVDAQGHFTGGKTSAEYLAEALGLSTSLAWGAVGGNNYAVGGALAGAGHRSGGAVPSLASTGIASQVAKFTPAPGTFNAASTLFYVQGGANDFFEAFNTANLLAPALQTSYLTSVVDSVSTQMALNIFELGKKGAKNILWSNLPDLGLTPLAASLNALDPNFSVNATAISYSFNQALAAKVGFYDTLLDSLFASTGGVNIKSVDTFAFMNANKTLLTFHDAVHPDTASSQLFASQLIAAAVPEPEMWLLMMVGVGLIGLRARRKA